jgi:hypothetical protein
VGLGPIACIDVQHCVGLIGSDATDSYGADLPTTTSDGGATWTAGSSTIGQAVSCVNAFCVSVGGRWAGLPSDTFPGDAYVSTDAGVLWTPSSVSTPDSFTSVACVSDVRCVAVGGNFPGVGPGIIMTYGA